MSEQPMKDRAVPVEEMQRQRDFTGRVHLWNTDKSRNCAVVTFGCQQNEADSERIAGMAQAMGYAIVSAVEDADLIVINTCAVREHAELRALSITGQYKHLKAQKPELLIGICGCMVSQEKRRDDIKMKYPYVNFSFGTSMLYRFPEILWNAIETHRRQFYLDDSEGNIAEDIPVRRESRTKAWVSIMYGCNNFCTYCVVPYVRGRERSRDSKHIIDEVRELAQSGYRDITLLGQNVNSYGNDRENEMDFPELLAALCAIDGDFTIRFMTSHPKDASQKLFEVMAREPKIAKQFHLPLQSGSDAVLKAMNRRYTAEHYIGLTEQMRALMPDISITSDIIVGFPGETDADFAATLDVLHRVKFDMVYSFIYSPRPGTPAAGMEQVNDDIKGERMRRLLVTQNEISLAKNETYVGTIQRVLVEGISKNDEHTYTGRTDGNKLVHFPAEPADVGVYRMIEITRAEPYALIGKKKTD